MAGGLAALLDDVALIAKTAAASVDDVAGSAAKTGAKAAGVVIDDAAVTPQFVTGVTPAREIPIIAKIARGSLINKLLIILPVALLANFFLPWILTPILMVGGTFLCFEGAEKVLGALFPQWFSHGHEDHAAAEVGPDAEKKLVAGATRTDLILSAEIMIISLNEVADRPLTMQIAVLVVVGILITLGVYGVVGLLVKLDDIGLSLIKRGKGAALGRGLVSAMPKILNLLSIVGTAAMLWVGGHIVVVGLEEFGLSFFAHLAHSLSHAVHLSVLSWLTETACMAVFGLLLGSIVAVIVTGISKLRQQRH